MRKFTVIILTVLLSIMMCIILCACNEYKEAQDEFQGGITSMMSEANDLKSTLDEQASGVNDFYNDITGQSSNESSVENE